MNTEKVNKLEHAIQLACEDIQDEMNSIRFLSLKLNIANVIHHSTEAIEGLKLGEEMAQNCMVELVTLTRNIKMVLTFRSLLNNSQSNIAFQESCCF